MVRTKEQQEIAELVIPGFDKFRNKAARVYDEFQKGCAGTETGTIFWAKGYFNGAYAIVSYTDIASYGLSAPLRKLNITILDRTKEASKLRAAFYLDTNLEHLKEDLTHAKLFVINAGKDIERTEYGTTGVEIAALLKDTYHERMRSRTHNERLTIVRKIRDPISLLYFTLRKDQVAPPQRNRIRTVLDATEKTLEFFVKSK